MKIAIYPYRDEKFNIDIKLSGSNDMVDEINAIIDKNIRLVDHWELNTEDTTEGIAILKKKGLKIYYPNPKNKTEEELKDDLDFFMWATTYCKNFESFNRKKTEKKATHSIDKYKDLFLFLSVVFLFIALYIIKSSGLNPVGMIKPLWEISKAKVIVLNVSLFLSFVNVILGT